MVGLATYQICKELSRAPTAGLRKRSNVVVRSPEGGYATVKADIHPGDREGEERPEPLPEEPVRRRTEVPAPTAGGDGDEQVGVGAERSEATATPPPRRFGGFFRPWHRPAPGSS